MADPSVVDALNTLRERLLWLGDADGSDRALSVLAVVETALADQAAWIDRVSKGSAEAATAADAAEARAVAAEAERDEAQQDRNEYIEIAERLQAERDTLRQALEGPIREGLVEAAKIIHSNSDHPERIDHEAAFRAIASGIVVARAVLAGEEPT